MTGRSRSAFGGLVALALLLTLLVACDPQADADEVDGEPPATCADLPPEYRVPGADVGERFLCLSLPAPGAEVREGVLEVGGYAAGLPGGSLRVELRDGEDEVVASAPVTVEAEQIDAVAPWSGLLPLPPQLPEGRGLVVVMATQEPEALEASVPVEFAPTG